MRGAWLDSFEFKEFEEFENCLVTLRPFGWRRIAFPFGGTPPPARELSACPFVNSRQGILARHLGWSFAAHVVFLEPSGVLLGPLGASWGALGGLMEPLGALLGGLGASWAPLGPS